MVLEAGEEYEQVLGFLKKPGGRVCCAERLLMNEKILILSAFGQFGTYKANISAEVARRLDRKKVADYRVVSLIFPCDITEPSDNRGRALLDLAQERGAVGILSLGMSSASTGFWFETRARNELHQEKYYPNKERVPVDPSRPMDEVLHMDITPWNFETFKREWESVRICPVELSSDEGGFCCEHLAYQVLSEQYLQTPAERLPYTFIHLPCCPEAVENPMAFLRSGKTLLTTETVERGLHELLTVANLPAR